MPSRSPVLRPLSARLVRSVPGGRLAQVFAFCLAGTAAGVAQTPGSGDSPPAILMSEPAVQMEEDWFVFLPHAAGEPQMPVTDELGVPLSQSAADEEVALISGLEATGLAGSLWVLRIDSATEKPAAPRLLARSDNWEFPALTVSLAISSPTPTQMPMGLAFNVLDAPPPAEPAHVVDSIPEPSALTFGAMGAAVLLRRRRFA